MANRATYGIVLAFVALFLSSSANAQALLSLGAVEVYAASEIGFLEQLEIAATRALIPRARVVAPLHAYSSTLACDEDNLPLLLGHNGSAAVVVELAEGAVAFYRPTLDDAVVYARENWCSNENVKWYLATTYPFDGVEARGHYLTRDVERIDRILRDLGDSR